MIWMLSRKMEEIYRKTLQQLINMLAKLTAWNFSEAEMKILEHVYFFSKEFQHNKSFIFYTLLLNIKV